jgi:hypothetical protein
MGRAESDEEVKTRLPDESFGAEKRRKFRTGWNQHKNHTENEDFRSKMRTPRTHKLRFFRGDSTWFLHRGGLRPPSLFLISIRN